MKKQITFIFLVLQLVCFSLMAQVHIGLSTGLNIGNIDEEPSLDPIYEAKNTQNLYLGLNIERNFAQLLAFETGLQYYQLGHFLKLDDKNIDLPPLQGLVDVFETTTTHLALPLSAKLYLMPYKYKLRVYLNTGVNLAYLANMDKSITYRDGTSTDNQVPIDQYKRWEWSAKGGAGLSYHFDKTRLFVEGIYTHALSNLAKDDNLFYTQHTNRFVSLRIGYKITLERPTGNVLESQY